METHATHPASGLPGTIELLKRAFEAYKKKGLSIVGLILIVFVAVMAVAFVFGAALAIVFAGASVAGSGTALYALVGLIGVLGFLVLTILVSSVQSVALVELAIADKPRPMGELLRDGMKRWKSAAWVMAITGFFSIGAFALLGVPGIVVSIFTTFTLYAFVDRRVLGTNAVLESHAMVSGRWWPVFGRTVLVSLLLIAATMAFNLFVGILDNEGAMLILSNVFSIGVVSPISILFAGEMYRELRKRPAHLADADKQRLLRNYLWTAIAGFVVMGLLGSYAVSGFIRLVGSGVPGYGDSADIQINPMLNGQMLDLSL